MEKLRLVRPEKKHEKQIKEYLEEFEACGSKTYGFGGLMRCRDDYDAIIEVT